MPSLIATLGANIAPFTRELANAKGVAQKEGSGIGAAFGNEITSKLGSIFAVGSMVQGIKSTAEWADKLQDLSDRTGRSTDELQKLDFIAEKTGTDINSFVRAMDAVALAQAKVAEGGEKGRKAFAGLTALGLTPDQIANQAEAANNFYRIADGLRDMSDEDMGPMLKAFEELGKGGKAFRDLLPAIRVGLTESASGFVAMSKPALEQMARLDDAFVSLGKVSKVAIGEMVYGWQQLFALMAHSVAGAFSNEGLISGPDRMMKRENLEEQIKKGDAVTRAIFERDRALKSDEAAQRTREQNAELAMKDRIRIANERTSDLEERASWARLTREQQIAALKQRIADNEERVQSEFRTGTQFELARAEGRLAVASDKQELEKLQREEEKDKEKAKTLKSDETTFQPLQNEVNSLQRIGGFLGTYQAAPELAALEIHKKNENHLAAIRKAVESKAGTNISTSGVEF